MRDYIFHVHRHDQAEPEVLAVVVRDDARAETLARERLALDARHHTVEVWRDAQPLFRVSRDGI
jgi:hypothetical protein